MPDFACRLRLTCLIAALLAAPLQSFAACSSPSGTEGEIAYNSTYHVMQFCDGSSWISMAAAATYLSETDPKVGTLTALKWCATNAGGTAIDCTQDAPVRTANNLSDLGSASTARTNLGLGNIATQTASSVAITGGAIDGAAIGGTTAAAGAFTTLSASGATALAGTLGVTGAVTLSSTLNVTGTITGPGSGITALNAGNLASGTVPTGRLGSGTASGSTYLRGDSSWAAIALSNLSDVSLASLSANQILSYNGSAWTNAAVGSLVAGVAGPTFMVNKNGTDQSVSGGTVTKVTWSNEVFDTNNNFASDKFTPTVAGKYIFTANVKCKTNAGNDCAGYIYKNGSQVAVTETYNTSGAAGVQAMVSTIQDMNGSADYVEAYAFDNGPSPAIDGTTAQTYFTGSMLVPLASGMVAGTGSAGYVPYWTSGNAITYDSTSGGQFYWDGTNHRLGIGTTTPTALVSVGPGVLRFDGSPSSIGTTGNLIYNGSDGNFTFQGGAAGYQFNNNGNTATLAVMANGGGLGIGTTSVAASSLLDIVSTAKGFLPPRMTTTQRDAISSPATGLVVYNSTTNQLNLYNGTSWGGVGGGTLASLTDATITSPANNDILQYSSGSSKWVNTPLVSAVAGVSGPSFMVDRNSSNQTITNGGFTKISWSNEVFDTNNNFASDKFTPTVAGKYVVTLNAFCNDGTGTCIAAIYKNGSTLYQGIDRSAQGQGKTTVIVDMNGSTDYLEGYVYTTGGTVLDGRAIYTNFSGGMLAPLASGTVAGTGSAGYVPVWTSGNAITYDSTSGGQFAWDLTNHRLGIGSASPGALVDILGNSNALGVRIVNDTATTARLLAVSNNSASWSNANGVAQFQVQNATATGHTVTITNAGSGTGLVVTNSGTGPAITTTGGVGVGTSSIASTAVLDMVSTTKGMLPPRMTTTQRDAIASPATGLTIYNSTTNQMNVYNGSAWGAVGGGALSGLSDVLISSPASGHVLQYNGSAWTNVAASTAMTTTTMVANWPDAMKCTRSDGSELILYLDHAPFAGSGNYYYRPAMSYGGNAGGLFFSAAGNYAGNEDQIFTNCQSQSIAQIYAAGRAFNFIGTGAVTTFNVGTVSAPGLAVTSDTNTGFWSPGADTLAISTGGTERVRIDSSGNVGIGTASPGQALDVRGSIQSVNSSSTTAGALLFGTSGNSVLSATSGTLLQINGANYTNVAINGNIGIGTTSPTQKLHVMGIGRFDNSTTYALTLVNSSTYGYMLGVSGSANDLIFSNAAGTERVRFTDAGNVGIGTASPAVKLDVAGLARHQINYGYGKSNSWQSASSAANLTGTSFTLSGVKASDLIRVELSCGQLNNSAGNQNSWIYPVVTSSSISETTIMSPNAIVGPSATSGYSQGLYSAGQDGSISFAANMHADGGTTANAYDCNLFAYVIGRI